MLRNHDRFFSDKSYVISTTYSFSREKWLIFWIFFYCIRKFGSMSLNGSTLSIDQQHTCPTTVMVCSGLNHKNCQSWSRLVKFFLKPQEYITNLVFSFSLQSMRARLSHITKWNLLRKLLCWGNATSSTVHHWTWNNRMKIGRQCIDKQVSNGQLLEN